MTTLKKYSDPFTFAVQIRNLLVKTTCRRAVRTWAGVTNEGEPFAPAPLADVTSLMSVFVPLRIRWIERASDRSVGVGDADHNRIRHAHKLTPLPAR